MVKTRSKLAIGDRIAVHGTITLLTPQDDGRTFMTVSLPGASAPITLDTVWSNRAADELEVDGQVRLEGRLSRITPSVIPDYTSGTMRIDGFGYPVTLLMADIEKA